MIHDIILPSDRQGGGLLPDGGQLPPLQHHAAIEFLEDCSSSGRKRPWAKYKQQNELLAIAYEQLGDRKADRLRECAKILAFDRSDSGNLQLHSANFCRVRLCPICAWRRSLKIYSQMRKVLASIANSAENPAFLHLVLTVRNVQGDELSQKIDDLMQSWDRFLRYSGLKNAILGWYRALEVAHNINPASRSYDTYHPHFHCILAVPRGYFGGRMYIPQSGWADLWRRAARLDYLPDIYIHRIDGSAAAATDAICELAKYTTKPGDYIIPDDWDLSVDAVRVLDPALHRRRLIAFGGLMRDYHRLLNLDDPEKGDFIHIDSDDLGIDAAERIIFAWHSGYRQYIRR